MPIENIAKLLTNTDHPVVERYLIAFVGYPRDIESATRDELLKATLQLDIDLNIRLHRLGVEFFDENGDLIPTPDDWKAQELLGFESTYGAVTLDQIIDDIDAYNENPSECRSPANRVSTAARHEPCTPTSIATPAANGSASNTAKRGFREGVALLF